MKGEEKEFILYLTIFLIAVNLCFLIFKISSHPIIIGNAIGYVNVTINQAIQINLNRSTINWGEGMIYNGELNATLYTDGENNGSVIRGNWTGVNAKGMIVQNIGNVNCSISILTGKNAHSFFNSSSNSNEEYKIKISNKESNACDNGVLGIFLDANTSGRGTLYCNNFNYIDNKNELYIDILFSVPNDAINSDEQSDIILVSGDVT